MLLNRHRIGNVDWTSTQTCHVQVSMSKLDIRTCNCVSTIASVTPTSIFDSRDLTYNIAFHLDRQSQQYSTHRLQRNHVPNPSYRRNYRGPVSSSVINPPRTRQYR